MEKPPQPRSSFYVVCLVITISLGELAYGYFFAALNSSYRVLSILHNWGQNLQLESFAVSLTPLGCILGCLSSNYFNGRRWAIIVTNVGMLVAISLTFSNHYLLFVAGRFLGGVCIGLYSIAAPLFIREVSPQEVAGQMGTVFVLFMRTGFLVAYLAGLLMCVGETGERWWRVVMGIPAVFIILQSFLFAKCFKHDSPKSYLLKQDKRHCSKVLKRIYRDALRAQDEMQKLQDQLQESAGKEVTLSELFSPSYRRALLVATVLKLMQDMSGYFAVILYSTSIFEDPKNPNSSRYATVLIGLGNAAAVFMLSFFVDRVGRRILLLIGTLCIAGMNTLVGLGLYYSNITLARMAVVGFTLCYSLSLGPIGWIIQTDLLPATGVSLTITLDWVCVTLLSYFYKIVTRCIGAYTTFWVFAGFNILTFVFTLTVVHETKGNSQEENRKMYASGKKKTEEELREKSDDEEHTTEPSSPKLAAVRVDDQLLSSSKTWL